MKKFFLCVLIMAVVAPVVRAQKAAVTPKLSAFTQQYLQAVNNKAGYAFKNGVPANYVYKHIQNKTYISAIIKVNSNVDQSMLDGLGILTGTKAGNIWTVQIPLQSVSGFVTATGIDYIEFDQPLYPTLDSVRKQTRVDSVQKGINLPMPITGKGVVVGIVDAGFDLTHPTFFDTTYSAYRIKKIWLQKTNGTPPTSFAYGNELTDTNAIKAQGSDTIILSHGTHVAGIAAGSGYGSNTNNRFRGIAYQSDIALVGIMPAPGEWINTGVSDVIDGINYIFSYATSVNKPAVVNLSWGSTLGPHDGNSLFNQACDNLTGAGKIFVCAAGNNGTDTVHLQKTFTSTDTVVNTFVTFSPYLDSNNQLTWIDVWGDSANSFCINVKLYNGNTAIDSTGFVCLNDATNNFYLIGSNGDTCFATLTGITSDFNGKPHAVLFLHSKVHDNICMSTKASAGTVNMWEGYVLPPEGYYGYMRSLGYPWATTGDVNMTMSDIACTKSAISVGAYVSKSTFKNVSNQQLYYTGAVIKRIASFSSLGPTEDNRIKPDITAPGFGVASSINSFDTSYLTTGTNYSSVISKYTSTVTGRTYDYAMLAGTSMASPAVSGIVALMLQVDPTLTPQHAKDIIAQTAIHDTYTGALPAQGNNTWGHGKINAYGAVTALLNEETVSAVNIAPLDCILYPNPNRGNFTVQYNSNMADNIYIQVYNVGGQLVHTQIEEVQKGANSKEVNLSALSKGIYFTKIASSQGYKVIKTMVE